MENSTNVISIRQSQLDALKRQLATASANYIPWDVLIAEGADALAKACDDVGGSMSADSLLATLFSSMTKFPGHENDEHEWFGAILTKAIQVAREHPESLRMRLDVLEALEYAYAKHLRKEELRKATRALANEVNRDL